MGILHDMLEKIHLVHDNALALADPTKAKTEAHTGFFQATADLVHGLEARIEAIEHALFGTKEEAVAKAKPPAEPATPSTEPSSTEPVAAAAPAVAEPAAAPAQPATPSAA